MVWCGMSTFILRSYTILNGEERVECCIGGGGHERACAYSLVNGPGVGWDCWPIGVPKMDNGGRCLEAYAIA